MIADEQRRLDPLPVFCVIDDAYRDIFTADEVAMGRFDIAGQTLQLGLTPDWLGADLPEDEEWQIEWTKFYYGLDLAHAYCQTADERYLDAWQDLVLSWIAQVPVDNDSVDVISRRIQNWTYAWARFNESPYFCGLRAGAADKIIASIAEQLDRVSNNLSAERNHRTLELYALFICSLAHPSLDPDGELRRRAAFDMYHNLCVDILADGVHRELSTHYHAIVLRSLIGLRVNAGRFDVDLGSDFDARVEAACEFLAHMMRPDGSLPMLSDSDDGSYADLLLTAAELFDRPDFRYVATMGSSGVAPADTIRSFDQGGYHVMRSGWGQGDSGYENERQLIFDCGPLGASGHSHYDAMHIEVSAGGSALLMDPGRFTYSEHGDINWRRWFKGTAAHNTLCVDGMDQTSYRLGKPKGAIAHARLLRSERADGLTSLSGEVISPSYDAIHRRRVIFVSNEWWIIDDTVDAVRNHHYEVRFHLAPEAQDHVQLEANAVHAPGLSLIFGPQSEPDVRIEQGWVARDYGVRVPAPVVVASADSDTARFLTAVIPTGSLGTRPSVRWPASSSIEVRAGGVTDVVEWGEDSMRWERRS